MTHVRRARARCGGLAIAMMLGTGGFTAAQVSTASGPVEGTPSADGTVRVFKGIPFAAPPVGESRWKAPAPVAPWTTPRKADAFGARCAQGPIFGDMIFRDEMSEDCLYVNVWTPAKKAGEKLPVMFWIHGGGFQAGSASEPRQDGEHLARKGVVVVSANHRLGVFGFLSHADLTKESGKNASGNYGLLDQIAALEWVQRNIAAFGGDPGNVTIFGESAGSFAVSALVASPLAKQLVHRAIGESGAFFTMGGALAPQTLAGAEGQGATFAKGLGAADIAALRAKSTDEVLQAALKGRWFAPIVDGYVLPKTVAEIYAAGEHNPVPLLAGWNADEIRSSVTLAKVKPTAASFEAETRKRYGAVGRRDPEGVWRHDRRRGDRGGRRAGERQLHRLCHVEVDPGTRRLWQGAGLPVLIRSEDPGGGRREGQRRRGHSGRHRRQARRRDRVRLRHARLGAQGHLGAGRSHAVEPDDDLLEQLREDRRPQRQGRAQVGEVQRRHRRGRPAPGHRNPLGARCPPRALRSARRGGGGGETK